MSYQDDVDLDQEALDVEWVRHPSLMLKYCMNAADAHREMDLAKARFDYVQARIDKEIRANPEAYGMTRLTEGGIKSSIQTHDDYQASEQEYLSAKWEYDVAAAAVKSFDAKKVSLENLVKLHGMGYFAGPAVPHNLTEEREKRQRRANAAIRFTRRE